ncbi:hypothetical protein [Bacillus sp. FJAT-26390]|uniref:hypothetical protein n=1 Tax=Bacillus sp. FJAT-26390 TaxID=1743142 RepID=UPI000807DADA|nr:hypothetical protein [Bacillus sp. FJAT-26390]OBZ16467.1 hypothetical protein A7975_00595 [Bacillus sp. FJAT-26390]
MKKRYILLLLLLISLLLLIGYNRYFYQFKDPNHATIFVNPIKSPDGQYQASAYYLPYGGAAGGIKQADPH